MQGIKRYLAGVVFFLFGFISSLFSQDISYHGVVLCDLGEPLPGVTIRLDSAPVAGVLTDSQGAFVFENLPDQPYSYIITYVGYTPVEGVLHPGKRHERLIIHMTPSSEQLEGVEVRSDRRRQLRKTESLSVDLLDRDFLQQNRGGSLMQSLRQMPGLNAMDIGSGNAKPIIRGMSFYRVLVAQNGIKLGGQQWSSHTGLSIDQHCIDRMEIIKGPASLKYGSDAIGGVINILPGNIPEQGRVSGNVSLSGKSNNDWLGGSLRLAARRGDYYVRVQATHNAFGDFQVPGTGSFILPAPVSAAEASHQVELPGDHIPNTAGQESALSATIGMIKPWGNSSLEFKYHQTDNGFFDYVGLQHESTRKKHQESKRDVRIPSQKVTNYSVKNYTNRYFGANKLELALGYQKNISREYGPLSDRTGNRSQDLIRFRNQGDLELEMDMNVITANATFTPGGTGRHKLDMVINTQYEDNITDGYSHILPDYYKTSMGGALVHRYTITPRWILNSGLRADYHAFVMDESLNPDPAFGDSIFNPAFDKNYFGNAASFGVNYLPSENTIFRANVGKSYRIPAAYELGAYGLHRHEGRFERGDLTLNPEQAWQLDLGLEGSNKHLEYMVSPFVSYFTNYLFLDPTPELRPEGQVYRYRQSKALLYGGEASLSLKAGKYWRIQSSAEYVYALNLDNRLPLPFTPPFSTMTRVKYLFNDHKAFNRNRICLEGQWVAPQNNTVPNELNTPGYFLLAFTAGTNVQVREQEIGLKMVIRNITNNKYFNHLSFYRRMRIPEPGRDFQLYLEIPI